jgi:hypothetical protein
VRDDAHHDRERRALTIDVHAKAPDPEHLVRGVVLAQLVQVAEHGLVADQVPGERLRVLGPDLLDPKEDQRPADARARRLAHLQVHVSRPRRLGFLQQLVEVGLGSVRILLAGRRKAGHFSPSYTA